MLDWLWVIPLAPFAGFAINGLLGPRALSRRAVGWVACAAVLASLVISLGAVWGLLAKSFFLGGGRHVQDLFEWMPLGPGDGDADFTVRWSYALDPLSAVMLLVVTGIGFLIHVYSIGYMEHEPPAAFARFFAYLNLFMAMMLTLVLGASLPVLFVGWEGVGLCSYLLIGFYYDRMFDETRRMSCADAGRKAFIVNRIGDAGFVLGMIVLLTHTGTLDIQEALARIGSLPVGVATLAALLLFVGVCGKSAQIPLFVWLPDAMAGPTPVSALIHAATMVTAGVYLTCRMAPLFLHAPDAMIVVAVTGGATALLAAVAGTAQDDIKKVLAYSTVSQLGYMVLAAGVGAFTAGVFHLMTHAFFKALLFLGAGSVIHALGGEQDIRRMGGLRRRLPITHATFLVAVLAIAGIPPLAGFFSKDGILAAVLVTAGESGSAAAMVLWVAAVLTAGLTAFYMMRLYMLVFAGAPRFADGTAPAAHAGAADTGAVHHHPAPGGVHESPPVMTVPLVILAIGSAAAGFLGVPEFLSHGAVPNLFEEWLLPVIPFHHAAAGEPALSEGAGMAITLLVSIAGLLVGWWMYRRPAAAGAAPRGLVRTVQEVFYVEALIETLVLRPYGAVCRFAAAVDRTIIDAAVNGLAALAELAAQLIRLTQTGYVRNYAFVFFLTTILILIYALR